MVDTFGKVLSKAIGISGKEILKDKKRLVAYLSDLTPECKKEVRIFSKNCSPELLRMFYSADGGNEALRQQTVSKARYLLLEEGLSEEWADKMVNAIVYALEWKSDVENPSVPKKEEEPVLQEIKQYELEEELVRQESRKISMSRKHGVLKKQMEDAKAAYERQQKQLEAERQKLAKMEREHETAVAKVDDAYKSWEECERQQKEHEERTRAARDSQTGGWSNVEISVVTLNREEQNERRRLKAAVKESRLVYQYCDIREKRLQKSLNGQKDRIASLEEEVKALEQQSQHAQDEFEAYNHSYQDVQSEIDHINEELRLLGL